MPDLSVRATTGRSASPSNPWIREKSGWTLGSTELLPLMHAIIRLYHPAQVRVLTKFWGTNPPDMVVSVVPNFDRSMWQALQKGPEETLQEARFFKSLGQDVRHHGAECAQ